MLESLRQLPALSILRMLARLLRSSNAEGAIEGGLILGGGKRFDSIVGHERRD